MECDYTLSSPGIVYYDRIQVTSSFREWKKILQRSSLQGNLLKGIDKKPIKVHIFWEGHKILQNLHRRFDRFYIGQIYSGDFAK